MKYLYVCMLCVLLFSCCANKKMVVKQNKQESTWHCPKDGTCAFKIFNQKTLNILKDDFGALYQEINEGDKMVLKFEYKRHEIPNTVDGHYSEQILMELNPDNLDLELENVEFKNIKLLFARFCYCKGQTGYYPVKQGKLSISKLSKDKFKLNLNFKVDEVPQIITEIEHEFILVK